MIGQVERINPFIYNRGLIFKNNSFLDIKKKQVRQLTIKK